MVLRMLNKIHFTSVKPSEKATSVVHQHGVHQRSLRKIRAKPAEKIGAVCPKICESSGGSANTGGSCSKKKLNDQSPTR